MIAGGAWLASAGGQKGLKAFGTGRSAGTGGCAHRAGDGTNVEVTGAARLYRAASGGPPGWASGYATEHWCGSSWTLFQSSTFRIPVLMGRFSSQNTSDDSSESADSDVSFSNARRASSSQSNDT